MCQCGSSCLPGNGCNAWPGMGGLAGSLIQTVDDLRQLNSDFGIRPYRVFATRVKWTGGEIGRGQPEVTETVEITPAPLVKDLTNVKGVVRSGGFVERGDARLTQWSARYTEAQITQLLPPKTRDTEAFIEVMNYHDGTEPKRRRFIVQGVPEYEPQNFQWKMTLLRQDSDRTNTGRVT